MANITRKHTYFKPSQASQPSLSMSEIWTDGTLEKIGAIMNGDGPKVLWIVAAASQIMGDFYKNQCFEPKIFHHRAFCITIGRDDYGVYYIAITAPRGSACDGKLKKANPGLFDRVEFDVATQKTTFCVSFYQHFTFEDVAALSDPNSPRTKSDLCAQVKGKTVITLAGVNDKAYSIINDVLMPTHKAGKDREQAHAALVAPKGCSTHK